MAYKPANTRLRASAWQVTSRSSNVLLPANCKQQTVHLTDLGNPIDKVTLAKGTRPYVLDVFDIRALNSKLGRRLIATFAMLLYTRCDRWYAAGLGHVEHG